MEWRLWLLFLGIGAVGGGYLLGFFFPDNFVFFSGLPLDLMSFSYEPVLFLSESMDGR
jgi:hypothetical protein